MSLPPDTATTTTADICGQLVFTADSRVWSVRRRCQGNGRKWMAQPHALKTGCTTICASIHAGSGAVQRQNLGFQSLSVVGAQPQPAALLAVGMSKKHGISHAQSPPLRHAWDRTWSEEAIAAPDRLASSELNQCGHGGRGAQLPPT